MPLIADPKDDAERRINSALLKLNSHIKKALNVCKSENASEASWTRTVDTPMQGPGFVSVVITDVAFCGGAHPSTATMSIVYDLRTGKPVDWTHLLPASLTGKVELSKGIDDTRMVTLSSNALYELFLAGYDSGEGSQEDRAACKEAVQNIGSDGPPTMMVWLDSKIGGLAVQYDLSQVNQACAVPVVITLEKLRAAGAQPVLIDAIAASRTK
ncbi:MULTISPECIES: hypothetical protein [unclassified Pseudomonas]|uniref:hypothetical protein n=1 Tax=unclassified Pseudomonas TaxID=196821 RepID=UPI002AC89AF4|nr:MULTISPECIES: hypothetical protein [unclassified Pseudomonas]MEB0045630.1 hypothetical protein [Pseudomonas sp. Dout3]MEB0095513.1 hypothetical protein [Pseudomonas sp. DC1.2]WPX61095.1 hypothetical protein RHM68_10810 [Pseudomonas sp. DC1.2]